MIRKKAILLIILNFFCFNFNAFSMYSTIELPQTLKKLSDSLNQLYENLKQFKAPTEQLKKQKTPSQLQKIETPQFCVEEKQKLPKPSKITEKKPVISETKKIEKEKIIVSREDLINREKNEQKPLRTLKKRTNLSLYELFTNEKSLLADEKNVQQWLKALKGELNITSLNLGDFKFGSLILSKPIIHEKKSTQENLFKGTSKIFLLTDEDYIQYHYHELNNDELYNSLNEIDKNHLKEMNDDLTQQYYISLMPTNAYDLMLIIETLLHKLQNDFILRKKIFGLVFLININFYDNVEDQLLVSKKSRITKAILTIIPSEGKKNAQDVLDYVYNLFNDIPGLDITPSYHTKINNLIYYGQGDIPFGFNLGSDKYNLRKRFPSDFDENTNLALYKNDFLGKQHDYALKNPATNRSRELRRTQSANKLPRNN